MTDSIAFLTVARYAVSLACLAVGILALRLLAKAWQSQRWASTEGRIADCDVRGVSGVSPLYVVNVRYVYTVDEQTHSGTRLQFGHQLDGLSKGRAEAMAAKLRGGAPVTVFFDPDRPGDSTLLRGAAPSVYGLATLGLALCLVLLC